MQQPGLVIYRPVDASGESHRQLETAGCRVRTMSESEDLDRVLAQAAPVHAILAASLRGVRLDAARLEALPDLRLVAKYSIGVDDVDVDAATSMGILVTHSPTEANVGGVAEGTIALMLALLKKLVARDRAVRTGGWRDGALTGTYLGAREDGYPGITIGIIGLGRIGTRVTELLRPWRVRVLAADPYVDGGRFQRLGVEAVDLDTLLEQSDVVSIHCNLTNETSGLLNRQALGRMKPGAMLINTARGGIVDPDALCDLLASNHLGGAALDVLPQEPPESKARILQTDDRVILSPHMVAANQGGTLAAAIPWATEAVLAALAGHVPERVYNNSAIAQWQHRFAGHSLLSTQDMRG